MFGEKPDTRKILMDSTITAFRFTLSYAKDLVHDIDDADMAQMPHPGMNHPAWILGHLVLGADFVSLLLGGELETDEQWMKTYGPGSQPIDDRSAYASKSELLSRMEQLYERAEKLVSSATEEQLAGPNQTPFLVEQFPKVGDLLTHLLTTHPASHLGQLSAWRRCVGKKSVLGL